MTFKFKYLKAVVLPFLLQPMPASLQAAEDADRLLEEIVVSGYRQVSPLETDSSITVLSGETIREAAIANFEELVPLVPNMNLSGEASRARYFQLRGIGEREQYEGAPNPSVGFYIDDIDLSGIGGVASLFDISQVEVLKGPQSARYGASALAGVVYMRSTEPAAEASANAQLTVGGDGLFAAAAALGGALSGNLQGHISLGKWQQDGFRDNPHLGRDDTNGRDELTARAKLNWDISDSWSALLTGLYMDFDNGYDGWTVLNGDQVQSDNAGKDQQQTSAASLRIQGELTPAMELVSISSFADSDIFFSYDGDWGNAGFWQDYGDYIYDYQYSNPRQRDSLSQEFRLLSTPGGRWFNDSTDWVIGVFWQRLQEDNQISSTGVYDDSGAENYCPPCLTNRQLDSVYEADTQAVFGSLDSQLTEQWSLGVGLRYEVWSADYRDRWEDINYPGQPPEGSSCSQFDCSPDEDLWGGHVSLGYDFTSGMRAYARIARGFKAGGFNPSLAALQGVAILGPEYIPFQAETLWNYEIGLKGLWLDDALEGELSVFYMDRDNAQLSQSSQQVEFDPNSFVFVTYNGAATVHGLEASLSWQPGEAWELHGSLGLLDSNIDNTASTQTISPNAVNRDLAHAPSWNLNLGASWHSSQGWFARLDFNASDAFYFDISHNQRSGSYQLVNMRIGKQWQNWALSAWGRNIFDEDYAQRGFYFGNEPPAFENTLYTKFADPALFGITLEARY
ncbi:MAG TPA: TonB-dependent receptor [Xanthomonadales bacterium]|nr:TonB-dependent receptor [Xanthomonadales bacterium]